MPSGFSCGNPLRRPGNDFDSLTVVADCGEVGFTVVLNTFLILATIFLNT
jgi:hypothetical protein